MSELQFTSGGPSARPSALPPSLQPNVDPVEEARRRRGRPDGNRISPIYLSVPAPVLEPAGNEFDYPSFNSNAVLRPSVTESDYPSFNSDPARPLATRHHSPAVNELWEVPTPPATATTRTHPLSSLPGWSSICCQLVLLGINAVFHANLKHHQPSPLLAGWCSLGGFSAALVLVLLASYFLPPGDRGRAVLVAAMPKAVLFGCFGCSVLHVAGVYLHATDLIGLSVGFVLPLLALCLEVPTGLVCLFGAIGLSPAVVVLVYCMHAGGEGLPAPALGSTFLLTELGCWVHSAALLLAIVAGKGLELKTKSSEAAKKPRALRKKLATADERCLVVTELEQKCQNANDAINTLAYEIRTPLQSLLAGFEMLAGLELPRKYHEMVAGMSLCGSQIMSNMNSVLEAQRCESDRVELCVSKFSPQALLKNGINIVRHLAVSKDIVLEHISPGACSALSVEGDFPRLCQVLVTLLSNAIKFSPPGRTVRAMAIVSTDADRSTGKTTSQMGRLTIKVKDSGPGMTLEAQDRLFQRIAQADASVSGKFGGSGLGLWICRKIIVDCMNGDIGTDRVRTAPGEGSVFVVAVPVNIFRGTSSLSLPGRSSSSSSSSSNQLDSGHTDSGLITESTDGGAGSSTSDAYLTPNDWLYWP